MKKALCLILTAVMLLCLAPLTLAEGPSFSDPAAAAEYIRGQMVSRNTSIGFVYQADISDVGELTGDAIKSYFAGEWEELKDAIFTHTGAGVEGDYLKQHASNYGYSYSVSYSSLDTSVVYDVTVAAAYYTTAAQEAQMTKAVADALAGLNLAGKSDYEKVRAITDFICDTVTYDYDNLNDDAYTLKYAAYAALINGTSVCQGYASLFYRMALEAGLDCRVITGAADNGEEVGPHAWNIVKVNGKYYWHDVTWIDGTGSDEYFLKGRSGFTDHAASAEYEAASFKAQYPIAEKNYDAGSQQACAHQWDNGTVTKAATCKDAGEMTYTCTVCHASRTEPIQKTTDHIWNEGAVTKASTCTEDGIKTYTCTVCGTTKTETINKTDHRYGAWTKLNDAQHQRVCSNDKSHVEKENHAWDSGAVTTAATCTKDGVKTYTCSVCGAAKTETVTAPGHKPVTDAAVAATCTADGKTKGSHCSVPREVPPAPTAVMAKAHQWDNGKATTAATCTADGVRTFTCTVCGATKTEIITSTGHFPVTDAAVAATCTKDGKTEGSHCDLCGEVLTAQITVKAKGHQWDEGTITKAPTQTEEGVKTFICTVCGETRTEPVGKLPTETENPTGPEGPTEPEKPANTPGDVDGDGKLTSADARLALRASVGLEPQIAPGTAAYNAADVDADDKVTSADARLILRASVGLEDTSKWKK